MSPLIILIEIWSCCVREVSKFWNAIDLLTLSALYSDNWLTHFIDSSLFSIGQNIVGCWLEVYQRFFIPILLLIYILRLWIDSISFLINNFSLLIIKSCMASLLSWQYCACWLCLQLKLANVLHFSIQVNIYS